MNANANLLLNFGDLGIWASAIMRYEESAASSFVNGEGLWGLDSGLAG